MSMRDYPPAGRYFILDDIAAAFIHREVDRRDGNLSDELAAMSDEEFLDAAMQKTLPDDYYDTFDIPDIIEGVCSCSSFDGHIETKYPENSRDILSVDMDDDYIVYVELQYAPSLINSPYDSQEAILDEFKDVLKDYLPESFDWWRNICDISGTYFA